MMNKKSILEKNKSLLSDESNLSTIRNSLKRSSFINNRASILPIPQELEPHLFKLVLDVIEKLQNERRDQTILISGESGAGKTETAKYAIKFITKYFENPKKSRKSIISFEDKSLSISLEEQIQKCNPILEAFGNAKTKNNDNSSRFGKYINIKIDPENKVIEGAEISTFLLEKTRLIQPGENERNFHIFYYLLKGAEDQLIELLNLTRDPKDFNYLKFTKCFVIDKVDDNKQFLELIEAFVFNGFSNQELLYIFRILAAILHFGNVEFEENIKDEKTNNDGFNPDALIRVKDNIDKEVLCNISSLLDIDEGLLEQTLIFKTLKIQKDEIKKPHNISEAYAVRDVFSKEIFSRLFNWIVNKLNQNLYQKYKKSQNNNNDNFKLNEDSKTIKQSSNENLCNIGILDIFGFESFSVNSFEQFCINFSNEKLQQLFIQDIFKSDEQEFIDEGLGNLISEFSFKDNKEVIDLFDKDKEGIFQILDDTSKLKQQDSNFYNNVVSKHSNNKCLKISKINKNILGIVHTAKTIDYTITGFVHKNLDEAGEAIYKNFIIKDGEIPMICLVFFNYLNEEEYRKFISEMGNANNTNDNKSNNNIKNTSSEIKFLGFKFRKDFDILVKKIRESQRHYIRCLKPNELKQKELLIPGCLYRQINYLGILDSIKIRKQNFPIRKNYRDFFILCFDLYELLFYKWINKNKIKTDEIPKFQKKDLLLTSENNMILKNQLNVDNKGNSNPLVKPEDFENFRKLCLIILELFFNEEANAKEIKTENKYYLVGKNKIFMIDKFLNIIEDKKNIYLITQINHTYKIAEAWKKYILSKKFKSFYFRLGMFTLSQFLTKKHYGMICRKKIKVYLMKNFNEEIKKLHKFNYIYKMIYAKVFLKKTKNIIFKKKGFFICKTNVYSIIDNSMKFLIEALKEKNAIKLQTFVRNGLVKRKYFDIIQKGKIKRMQIRYEISTLKIQKMFRGFFTYSRIKKLRLLLRKINDIMKVRIYKMKLLKMKNSCDLIGRNYIAYFLLKKIIKERLEKYLVEENLFYCAKARMIKSNRDNIKALSEKNLFGNSENESYFYNIDDLIISNDYPYTKQNFNNNSFLLKENPKISNNLLYTSNVHDVSLLLYKNTIKNPSKSQSLLNSKNISTPNFNKENSLPEYDYYQAPKINLFIKILDYDEVVFYFMNLYLDFKLFLKILIIKEHF